MSRRTERSRARRKPGRSDTQQEGVTMKVDTALVAAGLAEAERITEDIPDPAGIGAATLRLVVDCIAGQLKSEHSRFNIGAFQIEALPIGSERQKQMILAAIEQSKAR